VSLILVARIECCCFADVVLNACSAKISCCWFAGGLLARTDNCVRLGNSSGCGLVLHNSHIPADNNATGGGDGLLVTNISSSIVKLQGCSAGSSLNLDTSKACLQESAGADLSASSRTSSSSRGLLQERSAAGGVTQSGKAAAGSEYLVTSAAELHCFNLVDAAGASRETREACSSDLLAGPGTPFNPGFFVVDGLGRNVTGGIYDAQMPMQVSVAIADAWCTAGRTTLPLACSYVPMTLAAAQSSSAAVCCTR
jgi:hypothetical protein